MAKSFFQRVTLRDGSEVDVHVNRRGCRGPWTPEHTAAMQALVEAAHAQLSALPPDQRRGYTREQLIIKKRS